MSQIHKVFLGAIAIVAAVGAVQVGAVQLASGHDLASRWEALADVSALGVNTASVHNVNRAGKADRIAQDKQATVPTRTISMRLNGLADTSVLVRVPAVTETGNAKPPALLQNQNKARIRATIACEPMVSSLTEVAKLLQPGRCVT